MCGWTFQLLAFTIEWPAEDPAILLGILSNRSIRGVLSGTSFLPRAAESVGKGHLSDSAFGTKWQKGEGISEAPCIDCHLTPLSQHGAEPCPSPLESFWLSFPVKCWGDGGEVSVLRGKREKPWAESLLIQTYP